MRAGHCINRGGAGDGGQRPVDSSQVRGVDGFPGVLDLVGSCHLRQRVAKQRGARARDVDVGIFQHRYQGGGGFVKLRGIATGDNLQCGGHHDTGFESNQAGGIALGCSSLRIDVQDVVSARNTQLGQHGLGCGLYVCRTGGCAT